MSKIKEYVRHLTVVAAATLLAQCAWAVDVISINFGSGQTNASMSDQEGNDGSLLKDVPASSWNDFNDNSATDSAVAHRWNGESQEDLTDVTVSFSGRGGNWYPHAEQRSTTSRFLNGYIDDGANSQVSITVKNVPYSTYGVIVYYNGDNSGHRFKPVEVNGARYSIQQGKTVPVASDAKTPIWGLPEQTTVGYGKNAIRVEGLTGTDLTIKPGIFETVSGSQCRGTVAAVQIYDPSTVEEVVINRDDIFSASAAEALDEADIYNLTIPAGDTFTMDADMTRSYNLISTGKVVLKGTNLTAANVSKLNDLTTGFIFRIEGEGSTEGPMNFGAGSYSYPEATVGAHDGNYVIYTIAGDNITITGGNNPPRNGISYDINGGSVTIGSEATDGFWTGVNGSYNQTAGTVTALQNSQNQNGTGDGLLLGYSGAGFSSMNISGGDLLVENSSLQLFLLQTLNLSGTGHIKAKGVFMGNGNDHTVAISDNAIFELGSLGWKGTKLTLNGGTFKAYENATMAGAITMTGDSTVEVPAGVELKFTGSLTGDGAITKKGEGVLNVGTTRPTMDVKAGSVKIVATPSELVAGVLTLTVTPDASPASKDKVSVWDSEGNEVEITGVTIEGTTVTITLKTLPSIDKDTAISELELDPAAAGLIVVEGGATEEEAITITFDVDLPENVSMEINGFVEFVAGEGIDIPYAKMVFGEDATLIFDVIDGFDIPAGAAVIAGTASGTITNAGTLKIGMMTSGSITNSGTLTIDEMTSGTINNTGTLNVTGDSTYTLTNTGTLNAKSGVSTVSRGGDQSIKGTINIEADAEFVNKSGDAVSYGNVGTTVNVYGTLTMADNTRWTVGGNSKINLYGGCTVTGATTGNGAFDLYRNGEIITVNRGADESISAVTIDAKLRARNGSADNASEIKIASGMTLAVTGGFAYADTVGRVKRTGDGHFTGTIPLSDVTLIYTTGSVGNIPAHFVVSGTSTIEWHGNGSDPVCSNDSKTDPFITVNPNATLKIYGHDYSGWNGALRDTGWIVNNGTLVFENGSGSRFWREHIVMGDGSTVKIDNGNRALLMYGGAGTEDNCQFILPEGSATIQSGTEGDKAVLYFGNDGSGGWADNDAAKKATGISVGADATLTISCPIKGNQAITKHGAGTLVIGNETSSYTGAVTLNAGTIKSATTLTVSAPEGYTLNADTESEEGMTIYTVTRDAGTVYATTNTCSAFALADGTAVTLVDGDAIVLDSDHITGNAVWGLNVTSVSDHEVTLSFDEANLKGGIPANMNLEITKGRIYLYSDIGEGATITGEGAIELTRNASGGATDGSINNGASIACSVGILSASTITINGDVTISGTINCDGTIKLASGATLTCAELAEGKVTTDVEGKVPAYADGKYTLVESAGPEPIDPTTGSTTVEVKADSADAACEMVTIAAPEGVEADAYAALFTKTATQSDMGKWTVEIALDEEAVAAEDTAAEIISVLDADEGNTLTLESAKPGLYYQLVEGATLEAMKGTKDGVQAGNSGVTLEKTVTGASAFFRVKVSAAPIAAETAE